MARTARQRAALRKAQLASARKRKGRKGGSRKRMSGRRKAAIAAGGLYGATALLGGALNYGVSRAIVNKSARPSRKRSAARAARSGMTFPARVAYSGTKAAGRKAYNSKSLYYVGRTVFGVGF
jgi:hypothetical protein